MSEEVVGLDTSVVLRILTGEPEAQALAAREFLRGSVLQGKRVVVSDLVISEAYFALITHYKVQKREAVDGLLEMLERGVILPSPGSRSIEVLRGMKASGQKPGLVDRLIHAQYASLPASLVTFEKASRRLTGAVLLSR
jgi:predicted nucleic acid-binding protein